MTSEFVVMGANGGVGQDLVLRLVNAGHRVTATVRDAGSAPPALSCDNIDLRSVDVTAGSDIHNALGIFGDGRPLSGFAYCIGSIDIMPLKAASGEALARAIEVNAAGALRALQSLEKSLKAGRGSVVLFSSIAARQGFPGHAVISMAKGAVEGLAIALAAEWAGQVRVNCIAPSLMDTPIAKPLTSSAPMREAIEKMHPIPRLGRAEDAAALAHFLLDGQSGWITGQVFHVDGGRSTLRPKG